MLGLVQPHAKLDLVLGLGGAKREVAPKRNPSPTRIYLFADLNLT